MYTLYFSPGACSMAIHFALNELNLPYKTENVSIKEGKNRNEEFLKINPRGQVPVLVDDGFIIREGVAILLHLLEKHNNSLLPKSGKEQTTALEWLMFANATLHPSYSRAFFLMRAVKDEKTKEQLLEIVYKHITKLWDEVEQRLAQHPFICGQSITIADVLLTVIANWPLTKPIAFGPNCLKLFKVVSQLPAYQKALASEGSTYKAA